MYNPLLILALGVFLLPCLPAMAQTAPVYDLSLLETGAIFRWETSDGLSTGENLGFLGAAYVFETTTKLANGETFYNRDGATKTGQMLWRENNYESYYVLPNDCSFSIGTCKAKMFSNSVLYGEMLVETTYSAGIWTHIETTKPLSGGENTIYYCGIYDADAIVIALYMTDGNGAEYWQRLISGPDAASASSALERVTATCQQFSSNS